MLQSRANTIFFCEPHLKSDTVVNIFHFYRYNLLILCKHMSDTEKNYIKETTIFGLCLYMNLHRESRESHVGVLYE